ncbi:hypothetical protein OQZ33_05495 [Pedobacter sp. MC2016-05]|uniref:hypothetical protein n=1 Tax=Pedobacter sp. MC2016-05 TaxID=2994474 RepID=UPI00224709AA|nr:hypothetical protein [Pedobacter sp. MC2016-05]MCX2473777.1 hypothetical protein [Pedobacter sp. MC2016-05]
MVNIEGSKDLTVERKSLEDYQAALKTIRKYQEQQRCEALKWKTEKSAPLQDELHIIDLLREQGRTRVLNAVKFLLQADIRFGQIPYKTVDDVTVQYFVAHYPRHKLKKVRLFGPASIISLTKALRSRGYQLQS